MPFQIQSQSNTALSGTYSLSNTESAGNGAAGSYNVSVGNSAGFGLLTNCLDNTFVGSLAGYSVANSWGVGDNTFLGYKAGYNTNGTDVSNTSGIKNTFIGSKAGLSNTTASNNTFVGYLSGYTNLTGNYNVYIGQASGYSGTGSYNNFLGYQAGYNCTASNNNFFGNNSGYNNTSGAGNSIFGDNAGKYNQTGSYNSIFGNSAGYGSGSANSYSANSFFGYRAGYGTTTGGYNVFFGIQSGYTNTGGTGNSSVGYQALYTNSTGSYNCALGQQALNASTASYNNAFGTNALLYNTSGAQNCAMGYCALLYNLTSSNNTAIGHAAIYQTIGSSGVGGNTAIGYSAGSSNTTGTYNTYVGYLAQAGANNYTNSVAFGNQATTTNSNTMYLGNASTAIWGTVNLTSDGRFKTNITENVKGLAFIKKLRPVTYNLDTKSLDSYLTKNLPDSVKIIHQTTIDFATSSAIVHCGFIAQEVAQAAKDGGFISSIVHTPATNNDPYAVDYAEIVVPLVKALQEQQAVIDSLTMASVKRDYKNKTLKSQIANCCNRNSEGMKVNNGINGSNNNASETSINGNILNINVSSNNSAVATLIQNTPNSYSEQTNIQYFIPMISQSAAIMIFDMQGKPVKTATVTNFGSGSVVVNRNELNPGMFVYSLVVDGNIIDTKTMILTQ